MLEFRRGGGKGEEAKPASIPETSPAAASEREAEATNKKRKRSGSEGFMGPVRCGIYLDSSKSNAREASF